MYLHAISLGKVSGKIYKMLMYVKKHKKEKKHIDKKEMSWVKKKGYQMLQNVLARRSSLRCVQRLTWDKENLLGLLDLGDKSDPAIPLGKVCRKSANC